METNKANHNKKIKQKARTHRKFVRKQKQRLRVKKSRPRRWVVLHLDFKDRPEVYDKIMALSKEWGMSPQGVVREVIRLELKKAREGNGV